MVKIFKPSKGANRGQGNKQAAIQLQLDRLDHCGTAVATTHKPVVFVEGGLPGELCEVKITRQKARYWHAKVEKVLQPSPQRQQPFCSQFQHCGGCQHQHVDSQTMLEFKQQAVSSLLVKHGLTELPQWQPALLNPQRRYRRKTRLALDARNKQKLTLGYRSKGAAKVVNIRSCPLLEPELDALLVPLHELLPKLKAVTAIGHLSLLKGVNQLQLCLRVTRTLAASDKQVLQQFAQQHGCESVLEYGQDQFDYLSTATQPLYFSPDGKHKLLLQPNDFIQVNDKLNRQMVAQAIDWLDVQQDDKVLDLFAGVGNFSLPIAARCQALLGVEGVNTMVQRAQANALKNGITNAKFIHADLAQADALAQCRDFAPNKILLDPSREGAYNLMSQLAACGASHIVYVSCNPASFARDAALLIEQGYDLKQICLMDMFTYTAHTEMMSLFVAP